MGGFCFCFGGMGWMMVVVFYSGDGWCWAFFVGRVGGRWKTAVWGSLFAGGLLVLAVAVVHDEGLFWRLSFRGVCCEALLGGVDGGFP